MRISDTDYTDRLEQLHAARLAEVRGDPEWPMYSHDRPAHAYWNGVANALHDAGWNDYAIKDWLQSKQARWLLDARDEEIEALGRKHGRAIAKELRLSR